MGVQTARQYEAVMQICSDIFLKKTRDYGTAWRVLRPISIVDQIFIKAYRIRNIQEKGEQKVNVLGDDVRSEFIGIINYSIIGLIQDELKDDETEELEYDRVSEMYQRKVHEAQSLMQAKNHDYGEAWRMMSLEGLTDLILMKLQRMKQILGNQGQTLISEGLDANYLDMLNYSVFALILMDEPKPNT